MHTFKGSKLRLMHQAKAWVQVFAAQHARVSNHVYRLRLLRDNLIGDDNHEIIITLALFHDKAIRHLYAH
jgi:hypothetical protein